MSNCEEDIRNLLDTFYRILSGRSCDVRDWAKFRQLFLPDAHLTALRARAQEGMICAAAGEVRIPDV